MVRVIAFAIFVSFVSLCVDHGGSRVALAQAEQPAAQETIDINTATLEQLDALPGIGPSKAAAIIEARTRRPFRRVSDLLRVPGIGRSTLSRLAPFLRCDPPSSATASR